MTNEAAYNIISEFCFAGYEGNRKPSAKLFDAIQELIYEVEENIKLKKEIERLKERLEIKDNNFELYSDALDKIEQLNQEIEQLKEFDIATSTLEENEKLKTGN